MGRGRKDGVVEVYYYFGSPKWCFKTSVNIPGGWDMRYIGGKHANAFLAF